MSYIVVRVRNNKMKKASNDILIAHLNELGYEAFEEHLDGVDAYILSQDFNEAALEELKSMVTVLDFTYKWELLEEKNWNQVWEENYKPVVVADKLLIRSTFHEKTSSFPYEVIINPQMSFGTGHHETTTLMLEALLDIDMQGKKLLDVGCGTGILAIFSAKQGAKVVGVDIEESAYNNALENIKLNEVNDIAVKKGTVDSIQERDFDIIVANINRNVLLEDIGKYAERLVEGGILLLSGFYEQDIPKLEEIIVKEGLINCEKRILKDWSLLKVTK